MQSIPGWSGSRNGWEQSCRSPVACCDVLWLSAVMICCVKTISTALNTVYSAVFWFSSNSKASESMLLSGLGLGGKIRIYLSGAGSFQKYYMFLKEKSKFCSTRLHLFDQKYNKNSNITAITFLFSYVFHMFYKQTLLESHESSEIILICWFAAQETFLISCQRWKQLCCLIFSNIYCLKILINLICLLQTNA